MIVDTFLFPASVGLSFLQFTNMNSMRNLFITGVAFFLGLSVPEYFREYTAKALHGPAHTRAGWVSLSFHQYSGLYPTWREKNNTASVGNFTGPPDNLFGVVSKLP